MCSIMRFAGGVLLFLMGLMASLSHAEEEKEVSVEGGVDVTSAYFFRGLLQEDEELIVQPWLGLGLTVHEGEDGAPINDVSVSLGVWNSFHQGPTGVENDPAQSSTTQAWYESDLALGVSATLMEDWSAGLGYVAYTSPNDRWDSIHEFTLGLSYADSWDEEGIFGGLPNFSGFSPFAQIAIETNGQADGGSDEGTCLEMGVAPGIETPLSEGEGAPALGISIPVTLGFSLGDYYEDAAGDDNAFGYLDIGIDASVTIEGLGEWGGSWGISGGLHFLMLGETPEEINDDDDTEVVATIGVFFAD